MYSHKASSSENLKASETIQCLICFNQFNAIKSSVEICQKLYDISIKYLNSDITKDVLSTNQSKGYQMFCPECFESAGTLVHLSEKLEFFQNCVDKFISIFSFEILHRRTLRELKAKDGKKPCIALPLQFCVSSPPVTTATSTEEQSIISDNNIPLQGEFSAPKLPSDDCNEYYKRADTNENEFLSGEKQTLEHANHCTKDIEGNNMETSAVEEAAELEIDPIKLELEDSHFEETEGSNFCDANNERMPTVGTVSNDGGLPIIKRMSRRRREMGLKKQNSTAVDGIYYETRGKSEFNFNRIDPNEMIDLPVVKLKRLKLEANMEKLIVEQRSTDKCNDDASQSNNLLNATRMEDSGNSQNRANTKETSQNSKRSSNRKISATSTNSDSFRKPKKPFVPRNRKMNSSYHNSLKSSLRENGYLQCNICQKTCKAVKHFIYHQRSHTGEKPYQCESCEKSFIQKCDLLRHDRTVHKNERPFVCEICDKSFSLNRYLQKHMSTHSKKLYKCDMCPRTFQRRGKVTSHKERDHYNFGFQCKQCEKSFKYLCLLKSHFSRHHPTLEFTSDSWCRGRPLSEFSEEKLKNADYLQNLEPSITSDILENGEPVEVSPVVIKREIANESSVEEIIINADSSESFDNYPEHQDFELAEDSNIQREEESHDPFANIENVHSHSPQREIYVQDFISQESHFHLSEQCNNDVSQSTIWIKQESGDICLSDEN